MQKRVDCTPPSPTISTIACYWTFLRRK